MFGRRGRFELNLDTLSVIVVRLTQLPSERLGWIVNNAGMESLVKIANGITDLHTIEKQHFVISAIDLATFAELGPKLDGNNRCSVCLSNNTTLLMSLHTHTHLAYVPSHTHTLLACVPALLRLALVCFV